MKRWVNIMSALVFGAILLGMASGSGEAAPAPAGSRHETTLEMKHARPAKHAPVRHVGRRRDRHHNRHYDRRNPHVREIHHNPHRNIRHDRQHHGHHRRNGGNVKVTWTMDI